MYKITEIQGTICTIVSVEGAKVRKVHQSELRACNDFAESTRRAESVPPPQPKTGNASDSSEDGGAVIGQPSVVTPGEVTRVVRPECVGSGTAVVPQPAPRRSRRTRGGGSCIQIPLDSQNQR